MIYKYDLITIALIITGLLLVPLADNSSVHIVISTLVSIGLLRKIENKSAIQMMFMVGFVVFIYFPALMNNLVFGVGWSLFYTTSLVSLFFMQWTVGLGYKPNDIFIRSYLWLFLLYGLAVLVASLAHFDAVFFLAPFVMLYVVSLHYKRPMYNSCLSCGFIVVMCVYYIYGWSGFGRTVFFGLLITGFLYLFYSNGWGINRYYLIFVAVSGALLSVGRKSFGVTFDIRDALHDSAFGPYRLASEFIDHYYANGFDLNGFLDQVMFSIFSFVPRKFWSSKPYGFGFEYVVENMDSYLVDAGHSIASTLVGDHIYYLGWFGVVTSLFMAYFIAKLCHYVKNSQLFNGNLLVLFACNMMVLVWGGMTSFSARMIGPLVGVMPLVFIYLLIGAFNNKNHRLRRGVNGDHI